MMNERGKRNPPRVILSKQTPLCGCLRVELSKICNELLIFESQNAVRVLRILRGGMRPYNR